MSAHDFEGAGQGSVSARDEWRAGWRLPLVASLGLGISIAHLHTTGVFIGPLEREFGWSRTAITSGLSIVSVVSVCLAPFMGMLIDRWGSRRIGLPGVVLYCSAIACLSLATSSLWSWWALWLLVAFGALCTKYTVWTTAVASRFDKARGMALAITLCGAGVGSAIMPLLAASLVSSLHWRGAYIAMGALLAVAALPMLFLFFYDATDRKKKQSVAARDADRSHLPGLGVREAMLSTRFLRLAIGTLAGVSAITALVVHMVPILVSEGLTSLGAASAATLMGIGSIAGRLGSGYLLDRVNGALIGAVAFATPALIALLLTSVDGSIQTAMVATLLLGISLGAEVDVVAYLTTRFFGLRNFGTIFGTLIGLQGLGAGVGPVIAAYVYDRTGSYEWVLYGVMPAFLLAALMVGTLGRYPDLKVPFKAD